MPPKVRGRIRVNNAPLRLGVGLGLTMPPKVRGRIRVNNAH